MKINSRDQKRTLPDWGAKETQEKFMNKTNEYLWEFVFSSLVQMKKSYSMNY